MVEMFVGGGRGGMRVGWGHHGAGGLRPPPQVI
jgi:hypothetical protein